MKKIGYAILSAGLIFAGYSSSISAQQDKTKSNEPVTFGGKCQNEQFKYYPAAKIKQSGDAAPSVGQSQPVAAKTQDDGLQSDRRNLEAVIKILREQIQNETTSPLIREQLKRALKSALAVQSNNGRQLAKHQAAQEKPSN